MRLFRRLFSRLIAWRAARMVPKTPPVVIPDFTAYQPTLARDVSRTAVRFYSLCGSCGSRLGASATLCGDCAQKRPKAASDGRRA